MGLNDRAVSVRLRLLVLSCAMAGVLSGCIVSGYTGVDQNDFRSELRIIAGSDGIDCGSVEPGSDALDVNTCMAEAFTNDAAFYAVFEQQGIDSMVATGFAMRRRSELNRLFFDSDPSGGGRPDNGKIDRYLCYNPVLSGMVDVSFHDVFDCEWELRSRRVATR